MNVIATLLFIDLDANFQSILPNGSANVLASGKSVLIGPQQSSSSQETSNQGVTLTNGDTISTLSNQSVPGGGLVGRTELDPNYDKPFYVVPSEKQRSRLVSQTLIQDVIVLQMGDFPSEAPKVTPTPVEGAQPTPTPEPNKANQAAQATMTAPDVITLIVTPQDAVTLNYLIYSGAKLTLVLRGSGDDTRVQTEAVTLQFLMDQYKVPIPAKLPYGLEPRIDNLDAPSKLFQPAATPRP